MAIILGILAAFFFSVTFVLNQVMASAGGDWLWTAALRFLIMLPFFVALVAVNKESQLLRVFKTIRRDWQQWLLWSQVAFGLFYVPLTFASTLAPGWLIASTWQITIIAGSLIGPLLTKDPMLKKSSRITKREAAFFGIILAGIALIEGQQFSVTSGFSGVLAFMAVLVAAFAYPLGNRQIMTLNQQEEMLTTSERILAMLICSLPTWLICATIGYVRSGLPSTTQLISSFLVAVFSGVIATYLFFHATQMDHQNFRQLATVEATQSLEIVFSLVLGVILLGDALPDVITVMGLCLVISGMCLKVLRT